MHGWRKVNHLYLLMKQFHFVPPIRFSCMGLATQKSQTTSIKVCVSVDSIVIASAAPCCCVIHQHILNV